MAGGSKLQFEYAEHFHPPDENSNFVPLNILVDDTDYDCTCGYGTNLFIPESPREYNVAIGHVCSILLEQEFVAQEDKDVILAVMLRELGNVFGIKHQLDPRFAYVTLNKQRVEEQYFRMLC